MSQLVREFSVKRMSLNMLYADFRVAFNKQDVATIKISGDERMVNAVVFNLTDGLLSVDGRLPEVEINPRNFSISISNETIKINGTKLDKKMKLLVEMILPQSFELDIQKYALGTMTFTTDAGDVVLNNSGYMTIEAMSFNSLNTEISGMGDLVVDDIADGLKANISSSGDLTAQKVNGAVNITITGSGDVEVIKISGSLTAKLSDMGGLEADKVSVTSADVSISGSGGIEISELTGSLTANLSDMGDLIVGYLSATAGVFTVTGTGDVEISDGKIQDLTVKTTDMGGFVFEGHAITGSFTCSGSGDIEVDSCDNVTKQKSTGMGDIEIG